MNKALRKRIYPALDRLHRVLVAGLNVERRLEPFFRSTLNRLTREPIANLLQYLINRNRPDYGLGLAEEKIFPWDEQVLWNETQFNPLGHRYYSCVPYLLGEGRAMMYSFAPKTEVPTNIPGLPFGTPSFNYLRDNMVRTLDQKAVEFDLLIQVQTDPHRMPIENAAVRWPEKLSPYIPAVTIHIAKQLFTSEAQFAFAKQLKINPWHCITEHRPLGNQSRAR